jgi:hypothetical protein
VETQATANSTVLYQGGGAREHKIWCSPYCKKWSSPPILVIFPWKINVTLPLVTLKQCDFWTAMVFLPTEK